MKRWQMRVSGTVMAGMAATSVWLQAREQAAPQGAPAPSADRAQENRPATAGNGFEPYTLGHAFDALNLAVASDSSQAIACATSTPSSGATPDRALVRPRSCSFEKD